MTFNTGLTTILGRYIIRVTILAILTAILLVVGVDIIFALVRELKRTGTGDYTASVAIQVVLLTLPHRLYDMFPMACLLGSIMGLGSLAAQSELIVMRASGMSVKQIAAAAMTAAFALTIIVLAIGEWVVPQSEHLSDAIKVTAKTRGIASMSTQGTWIRDANDFIFSGYANKGGILMNVTRYRFNDQRQVELATHAREAELKNHHWIFRDVVQSVVTPQKIIQEKFTELSWPSVLNHDVLQALVVDPEDLSILGLYRYMNYLRNNSLDTKQYALAFWKKIFQPLSIMVMVLTAVPFVFGPLRNASMGLRMLGGVAVGFAFYMLNEVFGPVAMVYNWPPIVSAIVPCMLFAGFSGYLIKRIN